MTKFATSKDGVQIAFGDTGGDGTALLFVHGWSCDRTYWKHQKAFFEPDYRVVTVDLAGHGESGLGREQWTIGSFGQDVVAVIEDLGLTDVVLIGHSLGGPVVIKAANEVPERVAAVFGVDSLKDVTTVYTQEELDFFEAGLQRDLNAEVQRMAQAWFPKNFADRGLEQSIIQDMSSAPLGAAIPSALAMAGFAYLEELERLEAPLRLVNVASDPTLYQPIKETKVDFSFAEIDGVSHFLMLEAPERFNGVLTQELAKLSLR